MLWAAARFCLPRIQQPSSRPPQTLTSLTLLSPASATLPGFPFTLITLMDRGDHLLFPARVHGWWCVLFLQSSS